MRACRQNGLAFKQGGISKEYGEVQESHYFHKIITASGLLKHLKDSNDSIKHFHYQRTPEIYPGNLSKQNHYNTIQYNTIQYNTIQYNTIQYNTIQYNTRKYMHAETLALLTKPLCFPNMKYRK
jgi:hypothetical protein